VAVAVWPVTVAIVTVTLNGMGVAGALVCPSCVPMMLSWERVADAGRVRTAVPAAFLTTHAYLLNNSGTIRNLFSGQSAVIVTWQSILDVDGCKMFRRSRGVKH
jgi:hypothetical protein